MSTPTDNAKDRLLTVAYGEALLAVGEWKSGDITKAEAKAVVSQSRRVVKYLGDSLEKKGWDITGAYWQLDQADEQLA